MASILRNLFKKIHDKFHALLLSKLDLIAMQNGHLMVQNMLSNENIKKLRDAEFKVYSQWGEDGIISYLLSCIPIKNDIFIEFGVEDYLESNTRFLLKYYNWRGLVIDGSRDNINYIKSDEIMWKHSLAAVNKFVDRENINRIISNYVHEKDIGLLSVDVDGNDYWIWKAIDVVEPRIVVCEYNNLFGDEFALTIPYRSDFMRSKAHHSNLYFGASILALKKLASEKGYCYIGSNSAENNAFFVRCDLLEYLPFELHEEYAESKIRESRDENGELNFLDRAKQLNEIKDMDVIDVDKNRINKLSSFL